MGRALRMPFSLRVICSLRVNAMSQPELTLNFRVRLAGLSVAFLYLVLAILYESFFIPLKIMLVLPLTVCDAFYALALLELPLEMNALISCNFTGASHSRRPTK